MHEKVDVKVSWIPDEGPVESPGIDHYERLAAPSLEGPVGLYRLLTGDVGRPRHLRVALHVEGFRQSSFLITHYGNLPGDTHSSLRGNLSIGYTPWKYLEAYLGLLSSSNRNLRIDADRSDPEVILALADVSFGLKARLPLGRVVNVGVHAGLKLLTTTGGTSFRGSATSFAADAVSSFDLRRPLNVPLRFHLNAGYLLDNSLNLLPANQCATSTSNDPCIRSRVVETWAYGIGASRLQFGVGADVPALAGGVGIEPFGEYRVDVAASSGDATVLRALKDDPIVSYERVTSLTSQVLTFGLRVRPVAGLVVDAGIDIGLASIGFKYGPPVPQWNVIVGASYVYDVLTRRAGTKLVTRTVTRGAEVANALGGRVSGIVRSAATGRPLASAMVRYPGRSVNAQATADDGSFVSYLFDPGSLEVEVSRDDYQTGKMSVVVVSGKENSVEVVLAPKPPAPAQVRGQITDEAGLPVVALVRLVSSSGSSADAEPAGAGRFQVKAPAGDHTLAIEAQGYLSQERQLTLAAGQLQLVDIKLRRRPAAPRVAVGAGELNVKGSVHFSSGTATLTPDSEQLLDEVVDLLIKNAAITKLRVGGHTDNRGTAARNLELSRERAQAVVAYLVAHGIEAARLEAQGYGPTHPRVPNMTPKNRAANRRVEFKIVQASTNGGN